jgi:hypothetical protein
LAGGNLPEPILRSDDELKRQIVAGYRRLVDGRQSNLREFVRAYRDGCHVR